MYTPSKLLHKCSIHNQCDNTNNDKNQRLFNQLWYRASGLKALFVVTMFTKLRGLSTSEKSCRLNSSDTRYIFTIHDNFDVAFLNTVSHVPWEISAGGYFLQKSGSERNCFASVSTSSGGNKNTLTDSQSCSPN